MPWQPWQAKVLNAEMFVLRCANTVSEHRGAPLGTEEDFDLAISCSSGDIELAAALYRRLAESIPRRRIYFYRLRPLAEQRLSKEQLLKRLHRIYASSRVVVVIVGDDRTSLKDWEIAAAARQRIEGVEVEFFIVRRERCEVPPMIESLTNAHVFPDVIGRRTELTDIDRAAKAIVRSYFPRTNTEATAELSTRPPVVVRRHIGEFGLSNDYKHDFDIANSHCTNSCDVARTGVHTTAALLGSAEQYERLTHVTNALRKLFELTDTDALYLAFYSKKQHPTKWFDARRLAREYVEVNLLTTLISRSEGQQARDEIRADQILLIPDRQQLLERMRGYLSKYLEDDRSAQYLEDDRAALRLLRRKFMGHLSTLLEFVPSGYGDKGDENRILLHDTHELTRQILNRLEASLVRYAPCFGLPDIPPNPKGGSLLQRLRAIAQLRESSQTRDR